MQAGRFRSDLYYRLCSDVIETPSLAAQLRDAPEELGQLLRFLGRRIAGDEEAEAVAQETEAWITKHLGADYPWPGNVRELEQCLRNVMIRGRYRPPRPASGGVREELAGAFLGGAWTVEETVRRYCTLVFAQTGNYQETARRLGHRLADGEGEGRSRPCSSSSPARMAAARRRRSGIVPLHLTRREMSMVDLDEGAVYWRENTAVLPQRRASNLSTPRNWPGSRRRNPMRTRSAGTVSRGSSDIAFGKLAAIDAWTADCHGGPARWPS